MITYGSYMRSTEDIPKTGGIIGVMIVLVSLMCAMMIFPIIFTFGFAPESGQGLVFKTLPLLFSKLPGSLLISTTFFTLFAFTALTSSVALVEVVTANFMDLLGWSRKKAVLITGISCFVFGIPSALSGSGLIFSKWSAIYGRNFFETIDNLVSVWLLPLCGVLIAVFTGWILNKEIGKEEFRSGTTLPWLWRPWLFLLKWLAPVAVAFILLQKSGIIDIDTLLAKR